MTDQPIQNNHEGAYMSLMRGLKELDLHGPYVPSDLVLNGDHAFPLAMNSQGQVLMAASLYGRGRIVVLGHEGYLTAFPALVENALTWLRGDGSDNLSVGVHNDVKAVADNLSQSSFQVTVVGAFSENQGVGVYVTDAYSVGPDMKDLVAFLKAGGGVLIAGQALTWAAEHPKVNVLLQFEGNKVSGVAGIYFSEHQGEVEILPVNPQIPSSWKALRVGKDFEDDLEVLLQGVSEFDLTDAFTSEILVHGSLAFPIGTTEDGRAFLAGACYGKGRVIVITHEKLLNAERQASFWKNAMAWLDQGRNGVVETTEFRKDMSVFVRQAYSDDRAEEIQDFVAEGGGLLIGGHAFEWARVNPGKNAMTGFPGNKILNKMGLSVLPEFIHPGSYKAPEPSQAKKDTYHFQNRLRRFAGHVTQDEELTKQEEARLKKLGFECTKFLYMKAYDNYAYTHVLSILTDLVQSSMPQVSEKNPVTSPKDHLLLRLGALVYKTSLDPDALLPFLIKHNPSLPVVENQRITITANTAGAGEWISTGLYLSPGMKTEMIVPANIVNKSWTILIGCQTDNLDHGELKRAANVHELFPVTSEKIQVWNLWGGLIYLVAPPNTKVEGAEITVQMAVLAPYYKSGVTTEADWLSLRTAASPWAELEFENMVLTLPSHFIRDLERPDKVATLWDDIMRGVADLAVTPNKFARKERIVAEVQISAGLLHAGYPIMASKSEAPGLVNADRAREHGIWGPIHELGHNQQRDCWEFKHHTTDATCNLWSVYVHDVVLGIDRATAHGWVSVEGQKNLVDEYVKKGKKLSDWYEWTALATYLQLQEKFGWDAFKKVFAAYHKIIVYPSDNDGKMNLYAETFSQTVKMNLAGFFKAWSWPIETATEEKLSNLPAWSDHPMVQYD